MHELMKIIDLREANRWINPETKLVGVPDGYFWRVSETGQVILMREVTYKSLFGEKVREVRVRSVWAEDASSLEGINKSCHEVLNEIGTEFKFKRFVGDYK